MTAMRAWMRRASLGVGGAVLAVLVLVGGVYGAVQAGGNVHVVEPGQVIRSAQPSAIRLHDIVQRYGVRSVLNLRGNNAGQPWYDDEIAVSRADALVHIDYALSAERDVSPRQMSELLQAVATAPKPLLIHCNAGADRTGLVSALYELSRGKPVAEAAHQLSLRYGHVPYLWSKTGAMDRSFQVFVAQHAASAR